MLKLDGVERKCKLNETMHGDLRPIHGRERRD